MTLDEAIKHCEQKAEEIRKANEEMPTECKLSEDLCECAREHEQLAEWLKQLQKVTNVVEHWNDDSHSFVSACNAFESILDIFGKGVMKNERL